MNNKIYYSWQNLNDDVVQLGKDIVSSKFTPQKIVGVVRGGCVPAIMLSHMMNVPMTPLKWSKRDWIERNFGQWMDFVVDAANGTKILIVEDIVDSGETLHEMLELASKYFNPTLWRSNLRISSLWFNTSQAVVHADYYRNSINRNEDQRWIVFPYEIESLK